MSDERHGKDVAGTWDEHGYKILAGGSAGLLALGTIVYRLLEGWSWIDSIYFSTITLTTVGFGDLAPSTPASKLFTVFYVLSGVTVLATFLRTRFDVRRRTRRDGKAV